MQPLRYDAAAEDVRDLAPGELSQARRASSGILLSGLLFSFLGAILPAWGYHLRSEFTTVGSYFLSVAGGIVVSVWGVQHLLRARGIRAKLLTACITASLSFLLLAFSSPPAPLWWRIAGLFWIGFSAGLLNGGVFDAIAPLYRNDRAGMVNLAGALFGSGCILTALLVAGTYYVYTVPSIVILFAAMSLTWAGIYAQGKFGESTREQLRVRQVLKDFRNPGVVLFAVLLVFQFGNEWSIAGWLPLFLIRRLGISPETSLLMLAMFWAVLSLARLIGQPLRVHSRHGAFLTASLFSALLGCAILDFTTNRFGAGMGIVFVAGGFAFIYPLMMKKIAHRFPYYHAGFYHGMSLLALSGGMLAPWIVGYFAEYWGIQAILALPLLGTCVVFMLSLLILLEAKLSGA